MRKEAVKEVAVRIRRGGNLGALARALRLVKGKKTWRHISGPGDRYRFRCQKCGCAAMEAINEKVKKKHHTPTAHRRRTIIRCLLCGTVTEVFYGG